MCYRKIIVRDYVTKLHMKNVDENKFCTAIIYGIFMYTRIIENTRSYGIFGNRFEER